MIQGNTTIKKVYGLNEHLPIIEAYIQGSVYCWCKNKKGEKFYVRDLVGGDNTDWTGTPLLILYTRQIDNGKTHEEAMEQAAKDIGWLFNKVLRDDDRRFETGKDWTRWYKWLPDGSA